MDHIDITIVDPNISLDSMNVTLGKKIDLKIVHETVHEIVTEIFHEIVTKIDPEYSTKLFLKLFQIVPENCL